MTSQNERWLVEEGPVFERLDCYLRAKFPSLTRGTIQRLIIEGHIRVNEQPAKSSHRPRIGEVISVCWPEPKPALAQPEAIPLDVLYEDNVLLVLNKPPGIVVHPAAGHEAHTLVNALLHHCSGRLSGIGGVIRPGIVHRLDKDTSGCLVVAKDDATHVALATQFAKREVEKIYHGIVCGEPTEERGEIRASIGRHPSHRKRMAVREGQGRRAWTSYRVMERLGECSLIEAYLHTGRTHQVRVHFHHLGYPLLGDMLYGKSRTRYIEAVTGYRPPRLLLHAYSLSFVHPVTAEKMGWEAPWPADLSHAIRQLRLRARSAACNETPFDQGV